MHATEIPLGASDAPRFAAAAARGARQADPTAARAGAGGVVLIVDPAPDQLLALQEALGEAGYTVRTAACGDSALTSVARCQPDIVLLDAGLPGPGGLEVARRLKAGASTAATPIVMMTGPADSGHVVGAFDVGAVDCVSKPVRVSELIARLECHLRAARSQSQARSALDAFGHATMVVRERDGRRLWQTALARDLLQRQYPTTPDFGTPAPVLSWIAQEATRRRAGAPSNDLTVGQGAHRLTFSMHAMEEDGTPGSEWLVVLRQESEAVHFDALMRAFALTAREAEVLYWVIQGKTNRDIGDILSLSPRTVHKHLEHVFHKLAVETRTAAARLAMSRMRFVRT